MELEVCCNRVRLPDRVLIFADEARAHTFAHCLINFSLLECLELHPPVSELATLLSWETQAPRFLGMGLHDPVAERD